MHSNNTLQVFCLYKGIIFDIGGVLVDVRIKSFLEHFVRQTGFSKDQLYSMIVMGGEWERFEKGLITDEQLKERIEKDHGIKPELMERMADDWRKSLKPIPKSIEIVRKLKRQGKYKLFALSNVDEVTTRQCLDRFKFYKHFDGVVLSWEVHMRKPEPEIYQYVLKRMRLSPEETIFIDNYPLNLPPAKAMGMHTILFTNQGKLVYELRKAGIEI
jgi:putative hydrolase of the HAD superfamily